MVRVEGMSEDIHGQVLFFHDVIVLVLESKRSKWDVQQKLLV